MGAVTAEAREQEAVVAKLVPVKSVSGAGGHGGSANHTPVPRVMVPAAPLPTLEVSALRVQRLPWAWTRMSPCLATLTSARPKFTKRGKLLK